jgi:hypothetical protein
MARDFAGGHLAVANADPIRTAFTTHWTCSAWVWLDAVVNNASVLTFQAGDANLPIVLSTGTGGSEGTAGGMFTGFFHITNNWRVANEGVAQTIGRWVHWAGVWDGTNISLYKDGKLAARNTGGAGAAINPTLAGSAFYVGRNWTAATFVNGRIEHVALWDTALTYRELTQLAVSRRIDPRQHRQQRLRCYWPMFDGTVERDRGSSMTHLTQSGSASTSAEPETSLEVATPFSFVQLESFIFAPFIASTTQMFPQEIDRAVFVVPLTVRWARN